ncbi:MAG: DUF423 domain-containing protein [Opitutales bacterium]|jgi:uncharacterized membrane protein YgdD (TMEM256/DUF423 family)
MRLRAVAALLAATAVGLGAFGAHGLRARLEALPAAAEWWRTATLYLLVHAAAVAVLPAGRRGARLCLLGGAVIFAGTLYAMALGAPTWLGAVTPVGGTALIAGWIWLAVASGRAAAGDVS